MSMSALFGQQVPISGSFCLPLRVLSAPAFLAIAVFSCLLSAFPLLVRYIPPVWQLVHLQFAGLQLNCAPIGLLDDLVGHRLVA